MLGSTPTESPTSSTLGCFLGEVQLSVSVLTDGELLDPCVCRLGQEVPINAPPPCGCSSSPEREVLYENMFKKQSKLLELLPLTVGWSIGVEKANSVKGDFLSESGGLVKQGGTWS